MSERLSVSAFFLRQGILTDFFQGFPDGDDLTAGQCLPVFFDKISQSVVDTHIQAQAKRLQDRFLHFHQSKPLDSFKTFLNLKATDVEKLRLALLNWLQERNAPITSDEQALFHFALDWYLQTGRNFSQTDAPSVAFDAEPFREQVLKDHANLLSCQALRYLLRQADRLERQTHTPAARFCMSCRNPARHSPVGANAFSMRHLPISIKNATGSWKNTSLLSQAFPQNFGSGSPTMRIVTSKRRYGHCFPQDGRQRKWNH